MDGVFRAVRWVMRGFDAADSERTVRPESPTSPNVEIGPTAKTKPLYPMLAEDCEQSIISSDELDSEEMRRVMAENSLPFLLTLEQHRVNDTAFEMPNNSWCSPSSCTRSFPCSARC